MSEENEYKSLLEEMLNWAFNIRLYLGKKISPEKMVRLVQEDFQVYDTFKAAFNEITTKGGQQNNEQDKGKDIQ